MDFKGLLDDETLARIDKDAGLQQALALMAASGPSLMPQNLGSILLQGNQVRDQSRQQGLQGAMQRQELLQQRQRQQQLKSLLGMFSPTNAQAALAGGGGPTIANAQRIGQPVTPERAQQILMLATETGDPMLIEEVRKAKETLMPSFEYASAFEIKGQNGEPISVAMGKDGSVRTVGEKPVKLEMKDLGNRVDFVNPYTNKIVGSTTKGQSPDSKATSELGFARLNFEKEQANKPAYDFMTVDGRVMIGDKRTGQVIGQTTASPKDVQQSLGAVGAIMEAANIIPKSTGSYLGIAADEAMGAFGIGTPGAQAAAQLDVLAAKLTSNVPRFEGPQGVMDVKIYQQAAADVGNRAKPASVRLAALKTMADMTRKDAESKGIPLPPEFTQFLSGMQQSDVSRGSTGEWSIKPAGQ